MLDPILRLRLAPIDWPTKKMNWVKKVFLMSAANNKAFLAQLIFIGGQINARSGLVEVAV